MAAYILDTGSPEAAREFASLDAFTQGYIECALWADGNAGSLSPESDGDGETDATFAEIAAQTLQQMKLDCQAFQTANAVDIEVAETAGRDRGHLGHDFWLSRNGHGAGFWDRGLGEAGDRLQTAAEAYGNRDLYRGDDGLVYA